MVRSRLTLKEASMFSLRTFSLAFLALSLSANRVNSQDSARYGVMPLDKNPSQQ